MNFRSEGCQLNLSPKQELIASELQALGYGTLYGLVLTCDDKKS